MKTDAVWIDRHGGPEVLSWGPIDLAPPGRGEALLLHRAVGLNFIDVYHRSGLYPVPLLSVLGMEAAGVVEAVGPGVDELKPGQRVAYAGLLGAYSVRRIAPADRLAPLPDEIDDETAAAMMLKGLTAHYLVRKIHIPEPGQTVLVHAAAGGVGSIVCQWAKAMGAHVVGTVGSPEKAKLAKAFGCDFTVDYSRENFVERVREITGGQGVPVVYDGVGKDTFEGSLDCLQPRGLMVSYGNASGAVPPFSILTLSQKGSLFVTRPSLKDYIATQEELRHACAELFDAVTEGAVKIRIGQRFPLSEAAQAHRSLEARETTGSTILIP